jgi:hypothetical protein
MVNFQSLTFPTDATNRQRRARGQYDVTGAECSDDKLRIMLFVGYIGLYVFFTTLVGRYRGWARTDLLHCLRPLNQGLRSEKWDSGPEPVISKICATRPIQKGTILGRYPGKLRKELGTKIDEAARVKANERTWVVFGMLDTFGTSDRTTFGTSNNQYTFWWDSMVIDPTTDTGDLPATLTEKVMGIYEISTMLAWIEESEIYEEPNVIGIARDFEVLIVACKDISPGGKQSYSRYIATKTTSDSMVSPCTCISHMYAYCQCILLALSTNRTNPGIAQETSLRFLVQSFDRFQNFCEIGSGPTRCSICCTSDTIRVIGEGTRSINV